MLSVNAAPPRGRPLSGAHRSCGRFNGLMDLNRIPSSTHSHDFHSGHSRVVMVRKTEQRTFASNKTGEDTKFETVTRETVQTFSGSRSQKSTSEKRDVFKELPEKFREALEPAAVRKDGPHPPKPKEEVKEETDGARYSPISSESFDTFQQDCVNAHNSYRAKHKVPPLKLSKKLCKYSEEWAKHLANQPVAKLEHRPNNDYGENIFCAWSSSTDFKITGREAVDNWYAEIKDHPFGKEPRSLQSGHFTQVVWKDSKELGVGVAKSKSGHVFVVANYNPPGNFVGNFATNVPPVGGFSASQNSQNGTPDTEVVPQSESQFQEEGLKLHNEYRSKHGCPPLTLDKELCKYATEWAQTLAREDRFAHRPKSEYGENIFCQWASDENTIARVGARDAVEAWYSEIKEHEFGTEPRSLKSGHFTQMIWKNSQTLGIGISRAKNHRVIIVANYSPRGNIIGQFSANVPPPTSQASSLKKKFAARK